VKNNHVSKPSAVESDGLTSAQQSGIRKTVIIAAIFVAIVFTWSIVGRL